MLCYELSQCIQTYGASRYLNTLRKRFIAGLYTKEHFTVLAAQAYLLLDKPLRALTLLNSVDRIMDLGHLQQKLLESLSNDLDRPPSQKGCSLNMIVKDEAASIAGALDSVDDCMDEIVICDTGSTDNTCEIAALYGATVVSTQWSDDFSAARNEAIQASTRAWIFWMDADDRLERESTADFVRLVIEGPPQAAAFCIINEQNNTAGARFMQVRLFPRKDGLVFERRIHEQIMFSARRLHIPFTRYPSIRIFHTGYNDPAIQKRKASRNAFLIELDLKEHPEDAALLLNYGDCKSALGHIDQACEIYKRIAVNQNVLKEHPDVFIQAHFNIGCIYHKKRDMVLAKQWFANCISLDSTRTEAYFMLGSIFEDENKIEDAFNCYLQASRIEPPVRLTATNSTRIRMESIYRIARLMLFRGRSEDAEQLLLAAVAAFPSVVEYHALLGQAMLRQQKLKEAAQSFMQSLSLSATNNKDALNGMADVYNKLNDPVKEKMFLELAEKG